jgi:hypothetical protein
MCCDRSLKVSDQNLKYRGKSLKQLSKCGVMEGWKGHVTSLSLFCNR